MTAFQADRTALRLLETKTYSDFTLKVHGIDICLHQAIVCPKSGFFKNALKSGLKESSTRVIDLGTEDNKIAVFDMVGWFYFRASNYEKLDKTANIYRVADKYLVPDLKAKALSDFQALCDTTIVATNEGNLDTSFMKAVRNVLLHEGGIAALRPALVRLCANNIGTLMQSQLFVAALQSDLVELSVEILKKITEKYGELERRLTATEEEEPLTRDAWARKRFRMV